MVNSEWSILQVEITIWGFEEESQISRIGGKDYADCLNHDWGRLKD